MTTPSNPLLGGYGVTEHAAAMFSDATRGGHITHHPSPKSFILQYKILLLQRRHKKRQNEKKVWAKKKENKKSKNQPVLAQENAILRTLDDRRQMEPGGRQPENQN